MNMILRETARADADVFRFIQRHQVTDPRRGGSRVRELARLWYRLRDRRAETFVAVTAD